MGNCKGFIFYVYLCFISSEYQQALRHRQHLNSGVSFQGSLSARSTWLPTVSYLLTWIQATGWKQDKLTVNHKASNKTTNQTKDKPKQINKQKHEKKPKPKQQAAYIL